MTRQISVFLDSGAYSALTKGAKIDIQDYIKFIKENLSVLDLYANLDVIYNAEATLANQQIMEKEGLSPIPCYHAGEDFSYLQYYIKNYDYISNDLEYKQFDCSYSDYNDNIDCKVYRENFKFFDGVNEFFIINTHIFPDNKKYCKHCELYKIQKLNQEVK